MYQQVQKQQGGSTRRVHICKESTIQEAEEVAMSLLFPYGTSPNGSIEEFDFEIRDFSEEKVECNETICEMYDRTGMNILRFFLE
ncbi:hypothetical protein ACJMK2_015627 [Sinanodonta woodiana]|uniref:Uncharacterized protein n=1 Tax=Sinanodonta woodiana TaxID=1069815 RepID=A0ABD3UUI5_SINWO